MSVQPLGGGLLLVPLLVVRNFTLGRQKASCTSLIVPLKCR